MLRRILPVACILIWGAASASATVLFRNTGTGVGDVNNFGSNPALPGAVLEDGTFTTGGSHSIGGLNLGYYNVTANTVAVDALVTFFDTVDYTVSDPSVVNTSQIGTTYRFHITALPSFDALNNFTGFHETGLMGLTGGPLVIPDATFGMVVKFVNSDTNAFSSSVQPFFKGVPFDGPAIDVGTSDEQFAANSDAAGTTFTGADILTWGSDNDAANLYFSLDSVPEPASIAGLGLLATASLIRRRR